MKYARCFVLATLWMILALPPAAQVGGFTGEDNDRDGLPDDFEQAILEKFRPTWKISATDCNVLPAEFLPGISTPTVKAKNGTIYGQVFVRGSSALGFFVEAHFYDLWEEDCGFINSHPLDAEHVSVLVRAVDPSQPISEWHASQWYAGAHEDTTCDSSQFASAPIIDSEDKGATFWIARGKHGAFFSQQVCRVGGCGLDRCEGELVMLSPSPVNVGEPNAPLNGAVWTSSNRWPLLVKMRTDFPTFSTFSSLSYSFPDRGGVTFSTTGSPVSIVTGYASVQSNDTSPAGVSIFSFRQRNVLITEAAVPNSAPINFGRIYAEVSDRVNTGLAIANPNSQAAQVSFFFVDSNGRVFGNKQISIPAKNLIGSFLDGAPFNGGSFGAGTFTFFSSAPVSVVALRGYTNERGEFLMTTLPVSTLGPSAGERLVFPQLADGGGWTTRFVLVNPTEDVIRGVIEFFGQGTATTAADPLELNINGETRSTLTYTIAPQSSWSMVTSGGSGFTRVGSARVTPLPSNNAPSGVAIFSFKRSGIVVTETGVAAMSSGSAFGLFVESSGDFNTGQSGSLQTGIAIANLADTAAALTLELTNLTGTSAGATNDVIVPGRGQVALFLNQFPGFSELPSGFQGVLRISTTSPNGISVIGLRGRYNERRDFLLATTPAMNESFPTPATETLFPYIAEGGGYTTQFILSSAAGGHTSSGWLRFYDLSGLPLDLSLK
jgi:hypothetical protein